MEKLRFENSLNRDDDVVRCWFRDVNFHVNIYVNFVWVLLLFPSFHWFTSFFMIFAAVAVLSLIVSGE